MKLRSALAGRGWRRVLFLVMIMVAAAMAQEPSTEPALPPPSAEYQTPPDAPATTGPDFTLHLQGATATEAPVIAAWNESARPDESLTLTGVRFTLRSGSAAGSDTHVWVSNGSPAVEAKIVEVRRLIMTVTLPARLTYGMYFLWVGNGSGISLPVALNRTSPQWIGPLGNVAAPGALKRVFGKDLSFGHATATSSVYLRASTGGPYINARVTAVEPYSVEFEVPPQLGKGSYSVFVHNGHGGRFGWGAPLMLHVAAPWVRGSNAVRVPPAGPNQDDAPAIQKALNAQSALPDGGTVQLSEGIYRIASGITLPRNVRLLGNGKDRTTIEIHLAKPAPAAFAIIGNHVEIRGISFKLVSDGTSVATRSILGGGQFPRSSEDITLADIRLCATGRAEAAWGSSNGLIAQRVEVVDSEFFRELGLVQSDYWVHNNVFHGGTYLGREAGSEGAINLQGLQRLVLEKNHFETPPGADWTRPEAMGANIARRVLYAQAHVSSVIQIYIAHNTSTNVMALNENKGEMLLFHGSGAPWYGQVVSNSGTTMSVSTDGLMNGRAITIENYGAPTYSGPLTDPLTQSNKSGKPIVLAESGTFGQIGMFVSIVNGTGMGQLRQVTAVTANTITVISPWRLPPDSTSSVVLNYVYKDILIYSNKLDAYPPGAPSQSSASTFVQFDGNSWFNVVEGNQNHRAFSGARVGASPLTQSWWNEVRGNQFLELRDTGLGLVFWGTSAKTALIGPATLGNVFRDNLVQITGPQHAVAKPDWVYQCGTIGGNWKGESTTSPFPFHLGNIFENTKATGGRIGILAGDWGDTLYRKNNLTVDGSTTQRPSAAFAPNPAVVGPQASAIMVDNVYSSLR